MPLQQRIILLLGALYVALYIIRRVRRNRMQMADALFWILIAGLFVVLAIFPEIAFVLAGALGFTSPSNFVFLVVTGLLLIKVFSNSTEISMLRHKVDELTQEVALYHAEDDHDHADDAYPSGRDKG